MQISQDLILEGLDQVGEGLEFPSDSERSFIQLISILTVSFIEFHPSKSLEKISVYPSNIKALLEFPDAVPAMIIQKDR